MAKNYTFNEAVKIIANGTDMEAIADIGRRYPILATKIAVITAKAGKEFVDIVGYMPDYLTANKVNTAIKASIAESEAETTETDEDETIKGESDEAKTTKAETKKEAEVEDEKEVEAEDEDEAETTVQWNESMTGKQLWDLLGKAGKRKVAKSTKKADLIEACKKVFGDTAEDEIETEVEEEAENAYKGKSAMELYKLCKSRKIKAAPKKPAKFYADLLTKDDAKKAKAESKKAKEAEDDWDDWGDEEETETSKKSTKKSKKAETTKAKTTKKAEAELEDDDDDDWDI